MVSKTLWHVEAIYRLTHDTDDDEREIGLTLAASDDIAEVASVIITAAQEHAENHHGPESLADLTVLSVDRIGEVLVEED